MDSGVLEAVDLQMWCWLSGGRGCTHVKKGVVRCYVVKGVWRSLLFVCLASNPSMTFPNRVLIESRFLVQPKHIWGFPVDAVVKNPPTNAGDERWGLGTWVGKIARSREWQSTAVFLPGKSYTEEEPGGLHPGGCKSRTRPNTAQPQGEYLNQS